MFAVHAALSFIQKLRFMFWFTCYVSFSGARQNLLIVMVWNNGSYSCPEDDVGIIDALGVRIQWQLQLAFTVTFATSQEKQATTLSDVYCIGLFGQNGKNHLLYEKLTEFLKFCYPRTNFLALYKQLVTGRSGALLKSENNVLKCLY